MLFPATMFGAAYLGVMAASFQPITPNQMRGQTTAIYIFVTNIFGMAVGTSVLAAFPVWEFRALRPTKPADRQTHFAANGKMLMANDPFWKSAYPPYGYNCRCRVVARGRKSISQVIPGTLISGLPDPGFSSGRPALALG